MSRIKMPERAAMSTEQQAICDEAIASKRGHVPAPMQAWIANPALALHAQRLGALLRYDTSLPKRLSELAILVVAGHWSAHYEWQVHAAEAARAGLTAEQIADIAARRMPIFSRDDDTLVHLFSTTLLEDHRVSPALYRRACETLGETAIVELVGVLGYYSFVAMTLNAFEIGLPEAFQAQLA